MTELKKIQNLCSDKYNMKNKTRNVLYYNNSIDSITIIQSIFYYYSIISITFYFRINHYPSIESITMIQLNKYLLFNSIDFVFIHC